MQTGRQMAVVWTVAMGLAVAGCATDEPEPHATDRTASMGTTQETETELETIERELAALDNQLGSVRNRIDTLADALADETSSTLSEAAAELDERLHAIGTRLAELDESASEAWLERKQDVNAQFTALRRRATRMQLLAIDEKRAFEEALERRINGLEDQIEMAGQQLAQVEDSAEDLLAAKRDDLREQRVQLVAKWRELEEASSEKWHEMKGALVDAWAETQQQADSLLGELRDAADRRNS